jgi:adenylate cyclase class IV
MNPVDSSPRRNIELKARDPHPDRSRELCLSLQAEDHGELFQRDTYFQVTHGGLKLREQRPGQAHLIQFDRASEPQERESRYRLIDVGDGPVLRAALESALGVRVSVLKRRHLFIWQAVRIHLDEVQGLGNFIEFEAVAQEQSDLTREYELVRELRELFAVSDERLVAQGYAEQILALTSTAPPPRGAAATR